MNLFLFVLVSNLFLAVPIETEEHEFHLSKCDIIYSQEEKAVQISLQMFIDDLELALAAEGYENLGICTPKETSEAEEIIHSYVSEHLQLSIDGVPLDLAWVGKEISEDLAGVWCYLEVYPNEPKHRIDVRNNILVDIFADQRNIVKLVYNPELKAHFLFDNKDIEGSLKIIK